MHRPSAAVYFGSRTLIETPQSQTSACSRLPLLLLLPLHTVKIIAQLSLAPAQRARPYDRVRIQSLSASQEAAGQPLESLTQQPWYHSLTPNDWEYIHAVRPSCMLDTRGDESRPETRPCTRPCSSLFQTPPLSLWGDACWSAH